jgi:hypothetical protein
MHDERTGVLGAAGRSANEERQRRTAEQGENKDAAEQMQERKPEGGHAREWALRVMSACGLVSLVYLARWVSCPRALPTPPRLRLRGGVHSGNLWPPTGVSRTANTEKHTLEARGGQEWRDTKLVHCAVAPRFQKMQAFLRNHISAWADRSIACTSCTGRASGTGTGTGRGNSKR